MATTDLTSCSQASLDAGEPVYGSAVEKTDAWLLIEHDGLWAPNILDSPDLPQRTRDWVEAFVADVPRARPQLIRRNDDAVPGDEDVDPERKHFFFVDSSEAAPAVWAFTFRDYAELEDIDLRALASNPRAMPDKRRHQPLYLVCTHGKRDACCARFGPAVYRALAQDRPGQVWQTSHIGGHRFAATMLCFPHGHCFGRLDAWAARRVAQSYALRQLSDLDRFRGRTTYAAPVQAAEFFLRQELGVYAIDALHYSRGEILGPDRWRICFLERESGETHELTLARSTNGDMANPSCGKALEPVHRFTLESRRQLGV